MLPRWCAELAGSLEDAPRNLGLLFVVVERGDLDDESQVFSRDRAGTCTCVTWDGWWSMCSMFGLFGVDVVVEMVVLCVDGDKDMADCVVEVAGCCWPAGGW